MLNYLDQLIPIVIEIYSDVQKSWEETRNEKINLMRKQVRDIKKDNNIFNTILEYKSFLNDNNIKMYEILYKSNLKNCVINNRIKAQNSIEYKIDRFQKEKEQGKMSINKCLNDLFGLRIIIDEEFNIEEVFQDLKLHLTRKYNGLKCISSIKGDYRAIHIYFKIDNFSFPWELQIWSRKDEQKNLNSHKEYKQEYTQWENKNKGGDFIG